VKAPRTVGTKPKKPKRTPPSRQSLPQSLPATQPTQPPRTDRAPGTFAFVSDGSLEIYGANGAVTVLTTAKLRAMAELFGSA
jgi:hypothetical protein